MAAIEINNNNNMALTLNDNSISINSNLFFNKDIRIKGIRTILKINILRNAEEQFFLWFNISVERIYPIETKRQITRVLKIIPPSNNKSNSEKKENNKKEENKLSSNFCDLEIVLLYSLIRLLQKPFKSLLQASFFDGTFCFWAVDTISNTWFSIFLGNNRLKLCCIKQVSIEL